METKRHLPEASAPIDREFLAVYAERIEERGGYEEYLYAGQRYGCRWDERPAQGNIPSGWVVYKIYKRT